MDVDVDQLISGKPTPVARQKYRVMLSQALHVRQDKNGWKLVVDVDLRGLSEIDGARLTVSLSSAQREITGKCLTLASAHKVFPIVLDTRGPPSGAYKVKALILSNYRLVQSLEKELRL